MLSFGGHPHGVRPCFVFVLQEVSFAPSYQYPQLLLIDLDMFGVHEIDGPICIITKRIHTRHMEWVRWCCHDW